MRITGYFDMAIGACEFAVFCLLEFFQVDISRHALLAMAGKAVFFCDSGGGGEEYEACKNEQQSSLHDF